MKYFNTYPKWTIQQKDLSKNANVNAHAHVQHEHDTNGLHDVRESGSVHHLQNMVY